MSHLRPIMTQQNIVDLASIYVLQNAIFARRKLSHLTNSTNHATRQVKHEHANCNYNSIQHAAARSFNELAGNVRDVRLKKIETKLKCILLEEFLEMPNFWNTVTPH